MGKGDLQKLREQTAAYKKVAAVRVYATDKEISDTIGKIRTVKSQKVTSRTYPFKPITNRV